MADTSCAKGGKCIETPEPFITPFQRVVCSSAGAFVTSTFTTPLDVVKIRLQAQEKAVAPQSQTTTRSFVHNSRVVQTHCLCTECNFEGLPYSSRAAKFTGFWDALFRIARTEGVAVLWSGLPTTWVMAVPATVAYFTTYDQLKYSLGYDELDRSTMYIPVLAGCIARLFAATIVSPFELVRTKMQSTVLSYAELKQALTVSIRNNGIMYMMRGLGPSLLRDVPFSAIYWFSYELVKSNNLKKHGVTEPTLLQTFTAGTISGTVAAVLTLPFDVIKTHRQIELGDSLTAANKAERFRSTWSLISELYQKNGFKALFTGIAPRVMKVAPACAIMISIYEYGKSYFRQRNMQSL